MSNAAARVREVFDWLYDATDAEADKEKVVEKQWVYAGKQKYSNGASLVCIGRHCSRDGREKAGQNETRMITPKLNSLLSLARLTNKVPDQS